MCTADAFLQRVVCFFESFEGPELPLCSGGCKSKIMKRLSWFRIFFYPPAMPPNTLSLSYAHKQQTTKMGYLPQVMEVDVGSRGCLFCPSPKVQVQGCSACPESVITRCRCSQ